VQEPSNQIRKRKVGEAITPDASGFGYAGGNLGDTKPALESAKDRARGALMQKLPQEVLVDITDDDLKNLGRSGFTSNYALHAADEEDLREVLPDLPGLVASILKAYGIPRLPLGTHALPR
jgi:hypothetical protein